MNEVSLMLLYTQKLGSGATSVRQIPLQPTCDAPFLSLTLFFFKTRRTAEMGYDFATEKIFSAPYVTNIRTRAQFAHIARFCIFLAV